MIPITYYHPNAKGTGSALQLLPVPATNKEGGLSVRIAPQLTVGNARGPNPTFHTYGWDRSVDVFLSLHDITLMLMVLRGECESINDNNGTFVRDGDLNIIFRFHHVIDPITGYHIEMYSCTAGNPGSDMLANFRLSSSEALGISIALESSLRLIMFGE